MTCAADIAEPPRLIINADDLGLTPGVNRGILEAHEAGSVTSASVLVNTAAFGDAVARIRRAPLLGIGLHFNIVLGRPLTPARSLSDRRTGAFHSLGALARRAWLQRVDERDVYTECAAQLARLAGQGIRVTHVDSHRHAHALPGIWRGVVRAALDAGVSIVRVPLEPRAINPGDWSATAKKVAISAAWHVAARHAPRTRHPDRFVGISLQGGARFGPRLLRFLHRLPPGTTELMVHPGYDDPGLAALDAYRAPRVLELAALTSPSVRTALAGIRRGTFLSL